MTHSPGFVSVDLDSTLCDTRHRQPMLRSEHPDWVAYAMACENDAPMLGVVALVRVLSRHYPVFAVSARDEYARDITERWLLRYDVPVSEVWLAPHGTYDPDHAGYKLRAIRKLEDRHGQLCVLHIDDWIDVGEMLNAAGVPTLIVQPMLIDKDAAPPWVGVTHL